MVPGPLVPPATQLWPRKKNPSLSASCHALLHFRLEGLHEVVDRGLRDGLPHSPQLALELSHGWRENFLNFCWGIPVHPLTHTQVQHRKKAGGPT